MNSENNTYDYDRPTREEDAAQYSRFEVLARDTAKRLFAALDKARKKGDEEEIRVIERSMREKGLVEDDTRATDNSVRYAAGKAPLDPFNARDDACIAKWDRFRGSSQRSGHQTGAVTVLWWQMVRPM